MSREVKRVPLDFDWPMKTIWPPFMRRICTEEIAYCIGKDRVGKTHDELCEACRHVARLSNVTISEHGCPKWGEPPTGEGWQMWETTSEGSPISPVFVTPEELAKWLADTKASTFGACTADYETWLAMIKRGWAPTAMMEVKPEGKRLISGVQFIAENKE